MNDYIEFSVDCSDPVDASEQREGSLDPGTSVPRSGTKLPQDKCELWTSGEYKTHRWRCDSDFRGAHPRGKIISLADASEILKIVIWRGYRNTPRPLPDSLVRFETREITCPATLDGFMESPRKEIEGTVVDSRKLSGQLTPEQHIIVYSMTPGERCIARIRSVHSDDGCDPTEQKIEREAKFRYFIFDLLGVWKRTMLCPTPYLLAVQVPHGKLALAESPHQDSRIEIHFTLYKRPARDNPGSSFLNALDPSWELVLDTRQRLSREKAELDKSENEASKFENESTVGDLVADESNLVTLAPLQPVRQDTKESSTEGEDMPPLRLTIGQGTVIPGLEYALLYDGSILEAPGGQLFCSPFWVDGRSRNNAHNISSATTTAQHSSQRTKQLNAAACEPWENWNIFESLDLSRFQRLEIFDKWELLFDNIQVFSFTTRQSDWCFETMDEKLKEATRLRELGNWLLKRKSYRRAFERYENAYRLVANDKRLIEILEPAEMSEITKLHLNSAYSLMLQQDYDGAILFLDEILSVQPHNLKALYRKALCYQRIDRVFDALRVAENASVANPCNCDIRRLVEDLRRAVRAREKSSSFTTALQRSSKCPWRDTRTR